MDNVFKPVDVFQSTLSVRRATHVSLMSLPYRRAFQSTLSVRRATIAFERTKPDDRISIHALREESVGVSITIP